MSALGDSYMNVTPYAAEREYNPSELPQKLLYCCSWMPQSGMLFTRYRNHPLHACREPGTARLRDGSHVP